jgi:hypothetical protein
MTMIQSETTRRNGMTSDADLDKLADAGDRFIVRTKKAARVTTPKKMTEQKREALKALLEAKRREHEAFIEALHDPKRKWNVLDVCGSNLVELAGDIRDDAIDKGQRKLARKVDAAISSIQDGLDVLEAAHHRLYSEQAED